MNMQAKAVWDADTKAIEKLKAELARLREFHRAVGEIIRTETALDEFARRVEEAYKEVTSHD